MTIRFVGVAIGVRKAAAAARAVLMRTGRGDMPMLAAAATPIWMTISAVAVLLMSWLMAAVNTNRPASRARGPASPTSPTRASTMSLAAPVSIIAVESGIIAPTRITVVHPIAR
ncbi:hypothetical protein AQY21_26205 [Paracoccus sp. MKU1]|nr:hypothetical protein AQY21_26205 [Paracoccus sp. MKU1]